MSIVRAKRTHKQKRCRFPVRDPRAGILSDWFGIRGAEALFLAALYEKPGTTEEIERRTGITNVGSVTSRLRGAGVPLPKTAWRGGEHRLDETCRAMVREAYANTARLLGYDTAPVERIASLEDALGLTAEAPGFGLTRHEAAVFGMLSKTKVLHRERVMAALYGHLEEPPQAKIVDIWICKLRKKLGPHGYQIVNHWGRGYELVKPDYCAPVRTKAA